MTFGAETAQLMDTLYGTQRHFYDLTRKYYLLGRDQLISRILPPAHGAVLELGCGTGRNLIAAARKYPETRFYGLDISDKMLMTAARNIERAGLTNRIFLLQGDASDRMAVHGLGQPGYDRVFFSYTLSMMPIWREALSVGYAHLVEGGRLSVVDFGQQEKLPRWFRSLLFQHLAGFHVEPRADLEAELRKLSGPAHDPLTFSRLYRGYAVYAEMVRS